MKKICDYGAASQEIDPFYMESAYALGREMAARGYGLVFGGGGEGIMGAVARGVFSGNGYIKGIVPGYLNVDGAIFKDCSELIVTKTLRERKRRMEEEADAFIAAPGGFGTMEELLEITTLKQLSRHTKPIILFNVKGYFDPLVKMFEKMINERFAAKGCLELFCLAETGKEAIDMIEREKPREVQLKKVRRSE